MVVSNTRCRGGKRDGIAKTHTSLANPNRAGEIRESVQVFHAGVFKVGSRPVTRACDLGNAPMFISNPHKTGVLSFRFAGSVQPPRFRASDVESQ